MNQNDCFPGRISNYVSLARPVVEGDRWGCVHCGLCCSNDFEGDWLGLRAAGGGNCSYCPNLIEYNRFSICLVHRDRPYACRAFPFTLARNSDGRYSLVIHNKCRGLGRGRKINIRRRISEVVRCSNRALNVRNRVFYPDDPRDHAVIIKAVNKRPPAGAA